VQVQTLKSTCKGHSAKKVFILFSLSKSHTKAHTRWDLCVQCMVQPAMAANGHSSTYETHQRT